MNRAELVKRNQRLAADLRSAGFKQRLRNHALSGLARIPISAAPASGERLLIVRPDHLGDVLLSTPAIQALKRSRPDLSIHVLCGEWAGEALVNYDEIDLVVTLPFPGFQRASTSALAPWRLAIQTARRLRKVGYASAIIMRPDHWWGAMVTHLAGIPQRVGYDLANVAPFLTVAVKFEYGHAVEQNLRLVSAWTGTVDAADIKLAYPWREVDCHLIGWLIESLKFEGNAPIVCIHPGSGAASKFWRAENWVQVADQLAAEYGAKILFTGTRSEAALAEKIAADMTADAVSIAGDTNLGELAALYARSRAVLGPDSGALHLAAAVGTPTVALFGPADPLEFAPWGDPRLHEVITSDIGCRPCRILDWREDNMANHPCVRDITVRQVFEAARRILSYKDAPESA